MICSALPFQGAKDGRLFNVQNFLQRAAKPASGEGGLDSITAYLTWDFLFHCAECLKQGSVVRQHVLEGLEIHLPH